MVSRALLGLLVQPVGPPVTLPCRRAPLSPAQSAYCLAAHCSILERPTALIPPTAARNILGRAATIKSCQAAHFPGSFLATRVNVFAWRGRWSALSVFYPAAGIIESIFRINFLARPTTNCAALGGSVQLFCVLVRFHSSNFYT